MNCLLGVIREPCLHGNTGRERASLISGVRLGSAALRPCGRLKCMQSSNASCINLKYHVNFTLVETLMSFWKVKEIKNSQKCAH